MARPIVKREQIEAGVLRVVVRKGLHATTIQDIAIESGVSPGLLYRYWENRDELAGYVYRVHYRATFERIAQEVARERDFWTRIRTMIQSVYRFADEQPLVFKFLLLSQHDLASYIDPAMSIHHWLADLLDAEDARAEIRPVPRPLLIQLFVGLVLQPVIGMFYGRVDSPISPQAGEVFETLRRALRAARPVRKPAPRTMPRKRARRVAS